MPDPYVSVFVCINDNSIRGLIQINFVFLDEQELIQTARFQTGDFDLQTGYPKLRPDMQLPYVCNKNTYQFQY
jgi:hypothetical protein